MKNSGKPSALGMIPPQVYIYIIGIPVLVGVAYFGVIRPILKKTGVIDTPESKEMDLVNDKLWVGGYWNPKWYVNNGGANIDDNMAKRYAETVYDAIWGWGTDEEAIYGVFERLGSKGNISKVAEAYGRLYSNSSLVEGIKGDLGDEEALTLASKIANYN